MIQGRRVLGLVTARGGSKGLPGKNLAPLGGRPLISWTLAAAGASRYLDRCLVSTDDDEIARVAAEAGGEVPFLRPAALATDHATSVDVALHALDASGEAADLLVLLQPTSPLRRTEDIDGALEHLVATGAPSCVGVAPADPPPEQLYRPAEGGRLVPLLPEAPREVRRQDRPPCWAVNGAVYVVDVSWFRRGRAFVGPETVGYLMPRERSIDIDDALDLAVAAALLDRGGAAPG